MEVRFWVGRLAVFAETRGYKSNEDGSQQVQGGSEAFIVEFTCEETQKQHELKIFCLVVHLHDNHVKYKLWENVDACMGESKGDLRNTLWIMEQRWVARQRQRDGVSKDGVLAKFTHSLEELLGRDGPVCEWVNGVDHQVRFSVVL